MEAAMTRVKALLPALALLLIALLAAPAADATNSFSTPSVPWNAVPTFNSIGIYWQPTGASPSQVAQMRFRKDGATNWRAGHDLWFDARTADQEYRGSLVELEANATYEIQLKLGTGDWPTTAVTTSCDVAGATICFIPKTDTCNSSNQDRCTRTWNDNYTPTAGFVIEVPATGIHHVEINVGTEPTPSSSTSGTTMTVLVPPNPSAYTFIQNVNYPARSEVAQAPAGDGGNCINVNGAKKVVIRGLDIRNCSRNGIELFDHSNDIVIDDNDISGWGGWGDDNFSGVGQMTFHPNGDSAIRCRNPGSSSGNRDVNRVVVQRNKIHDPRYSATYWTQAQIKQPPNWTTSHANQLSSLHPTGPSALGFDKCGRNHVIRFNDIYATEPGPEGTKFWQYAEQAVKWLQDGLTGADNFKDRGFPWADSDIHANRITHAYDDAIEAEGYNRNVRIWGNYSDKTFVSIANAATIKGPLYVWRNVSNIQGRMVTPTTSGNADSNERGPFGKVGSPDSALVDNGGRYYFYHNTILQAPAADCGATSTRCGAGEALNRDSNRSFYNFVSRNNIWHAYNTAVSDGLIRASCSFGDNEASIQPAKCDANNDLFNTSTSRLLNAGNTNYPPGTDPAETNGWPSTVPTYAAGGGAYPTSIPSADNSWSGDFRLSPGTAGTVTNGARTVAPIPNFNDLDTMLNVGAHPPQVPLMKFGRAAATTGPTAVLNSTPSPATVAAGQTLTFKSDSIAGSSPITGLHLDFGDGSAPADWTDQATTQPHSYNTPGSYTATLTVTDGVNSSNASVPVTVTGCSGVPTAVLAVSPSSGNVPLAVTFDASGSSAVSPKTIASYSITYGDGGSGTGVTQNHTYSAVGNYIAVLTVTDSGGCTAIDSKSVTVSTGGEILPGTPAAGSLGASAPTFHSMSLYYNPASAPANGWIWLRYRRATESAWREGWPLWYDARTAASGNSLPHAFSARGSAVYLEPNTKYFFEFGTGASYAGATWLHHVAGTTWPEAFPEDPSVTTIPSQATPYTITAGGTPTAYKVYDGNNNTITANGTSAHLQCIHINASYVIVRRIKVQGCYDYGILVAANRTDVVIEDSDITDWSWRAGGTVAGWGTYGANERGGVQLAGNNSRVVIQRNKIHDPHYGAFPWEFGHPVGPTAVMTVTPGQQNVVRYNEVYASGGTADKSKWLQDGMMGNDNFSAKGFPGSDSDVYHNIVRNTMDDGIEAEGGGANVRVWGNYVDHTATGIATAVSHYGPIYVFRNVTNRARTYHTTAGANGIAEPDDDGVNRLPGIKSAGVSGGWGGGRQYFFNNTLLQQPGTTYAPVQSFGDLGAGGGIVAPSSQGLRETWSRNNILDVFRPSAPSIALGTGGTPTNDLNYDLYSGTVPAGSESAGASGKPVFKSGHGWDAGPRLSVEGGAVGLGNFQQDVGSLGLNLGAALPNFTQDIDNLTLARKSGAETVGSGTPDIGAHESGAAAMKFGIPASQ
jgi:PKD repeat protein